MWSGFREAGRPVTRRLAGGRTPALPSALDAALAGVARVVPAMAAARHRDALRGVVERGLALRAALEPAAGAASAGTAAADRAALDGELARLFDVAALASSRLDQLEAELSPEDLRSDDEAKRARWHVRDRWAARILQVTAFLDAMRARAVMARARALGQAELDDVRAQIAALAEIEELA
jgi:hypothetical protein